MLECPVCSETDIPEGVQTCETCNTDLTPIHRVRELAKAQFNEALELARAGARDAALSRLASAVSLDPTLTSARKLMGKLLWQAGSYRQAVDQWKQALTSASDDEEIKELLAEAKRQGRLRIVKRAAVAVVVVIALLFLATIPLRSQGKRLDRVAAAMTEMQAYRDTHSYTDEEHATLEARFREAEEAAAKVTQQLSEYREEHNRSDTAFAELAQRAEISAEQLQAGRESIDAERGRREQVAGELAALQGDYRSLLESLLPLVSSLGPADADQLAAKIAAMEAKCEWLKKEDEVTRLHDASRVATARHRSLVSQLQTASRQLASLREDYKRRIEPWKTAADRIRKKLEELPNPQPTAFSPPDEQPPETAPDGETTDEAESESETPGPADQQVSGEKGSVEQTDESQVD